MKIINLLEDKNLFIVISKKSANQAICTTSSNTFFAENYLNYIGVGSVQTVKCGCLW